MLHKSGVELLHRHGVGPVVLNCHPELGSLDPKRRILGDEYGRGPLHEVETGGKDAVVRSLGIQGRRQTFRGDPIELDTQRAAAGQRDRFAHPTISRRSELLDEPDRGPSVGADLVQSGLLPIQLLDDHERQHHIVFIESERGLGVGEQDTGIEDKGVGHLVGLLQGRRQGA